MGLERRGEVESTSTGRLTLHAYGEYNARYQGCQPLMELKIESQDNIPYIRRKVDRFLAERIASWPKVRWPISLALSEAVTNVVKFTPGGKLRIFLDSAGLCFHIIDNGRGFDLDLFPTIFDKGFSTSSSLGMGFAIMVQYAKKVDLYTSNRGTILVLTFDIDSVLNRNRRHKEG